MLPFLLPLLLLMLKSVANYFILIIFPKFFTIVLFLRKPGHHMLYMAEIPNVPLSLSLLLLFFPRSITENFRRYPEVLSLVLTLCVIRYIAFYIAH